MHDNQSATHPFMTVGTRTYVYVVLLVNKCHYWLAVSETTTYVVKPSFIIQEKLICHENSCFVCLGEITFS